MHEKVVPVTYSSSGTDLSDIAAMTEKKFWSIIGRIDLSVLDEEDDEEEAIEPAIAALAKCSLPQIKSFYNHLTNALYALDTKKHHVATNLGLTDDSFLYLRCYVVAMGLEHNKAVLADPSLMPQEYVSLEWLLSVACIAWERATGFDDFDMNCTEHSFESGSNLPGWRFLPNKLQRLHFEDTAESIDAMLATDRHESATLGIGKAELFAKKLVELDFNSVYQNVAIRLMPSVEHGSITFGSEHNGEVRSVILSGGIDTNRFVRLSPRERDLFFVDLATRAMQSLCAGGSEDANKIVEAQASAVDQILKNSP